MPSGKWAARRERIAMALSEKEQDRAIRLQDTPCIGCGVCSMVCPTQSICVTMGMWGDPTPVIDRNTCTDCGACAYQCPAMNAPLRMRPRAVYAAWSLNSEERKTSSSGGVATVVSRKVIQRAVRYSARPSRKRGWFSTAVWRIWQGCKP